MKNIPLHVYTSIKYIKYISMYKYFSLCSYITLFATHVLSPYVCPTRKEINTQYKLIYFMEYSLKSFQNCTRKKCCISLN